jgi:hypothetical protein
MTTQEQIVAAYLLAGRTWAEIMAEESTRPWPVPEQIPSQENAETLIAQARALATPLPRADFLLALLSMGRTEAHVLAAIAQIPEAEQAAANILFRHRASYRRDHPLVVALAPALGLTSDQVDAAWVSAVQTLERKPEKDQAGATPGRS